MYVIAVAYDDKEEETLKRLILTVRRQNDSETYLNNDRYTIGTVLRLECVTVVTVMNIEVKHRGCIFIKAAAVVLEGVERI
jgi:hypothetical protein